MITPRDYAVLKMHERGLSYGQIAQRMKITRNTAASVINRHGRMAIEECSISRPTAAPSIFPYAHRTIAEMDEMGYHFGASR